MIEIETAFKKKIKTLFPAFLSIYENVSQPSSIPLEHLIKSCIFYHLITMMLLWIILNI
jgi:hypothetical protein